MSFLTPFPAKFYPFFMDLMGTPEYTTLRRKAEGIERELEAKCHRYMQVRVKSRVKSFKGLSNERRKL